MLQVGLGLPGSPRGAAEDFPLDQLGKRNRSYSALMSSGGGDVEAAQGPADSPQVPVLIISEAETWDIDASSCMGCGQFVDWDKMPELDQQPSAQSQSLTQTSKELKKLAREGHWATNHALRARAYQQIIQHIPCRLVTPDALVYRDVASRLFGKQSVSSHPLPEFLGGCGMPTYCLTMEGVTAVKKILICLGNLFPDITYSPILPAVVALLLHYSEDEAQCFENVSRLIACNDSHTSYIDQSFLAHQASRMTFGDLANKHCPAAHRLIASTSENVFEVYSEWLGWIFGDLPFDYAIRVLDVYLLEGQKVLYRIALALLRQHRLSVTSGELEVANVKGDLKAFVQNIREHLTVDKLLERAFGIRLFSRKEIWLLQMANRKALAEKGVTVVQRRQLFHLAVDMLNFSSAIVTAQEMRIMWSWIPERFSLFPPVLLFSTSENGYSLQRFYSCCEGYEPTVLLIKTTQGEVCGAFLSSDWNERKKSGGASSFFGTGECFVFSVRPETERYEWVFIKKPELTKAVPRSPRQRLPSPASPVLSTSPPSGHLASSNHLTVPMLQRVKAHLSPYLAIRHFLLPSKTASMFMSGTREGIVIGGGGGQALYIDADLYYGRTEHCETFDNPPLCQENFQVQLLEAWGFQNA
ncbi:TBC1 domain family member 24-like isoform X2 [Mauremys reevesii]|uniref:TBC1 domain family member 24-like isoform X2 n=1 Tax=Mauremys reevesii TaxID=260615 RepID=UPI00193F8CD9|nr:TBC1 domain family member 24-like isoform X2 [Mauremys reevesii]